MILFYKKNPALKFELPWKRDFPPLKTMVKWARCDISKTNRASTPKLGKLTDIHDSFQKQVISHSMGFSRASGRHFYPKMTILMVSMATISAKKSKLLLKTIYTCWPAYLAHIMLKIGEKKTKITDWQPFFNFDHAFRKMLVAMVTQKWTRFFPENRLPVTYW